MPGTEAGAEAGVLRIDFWGIADEDALLSWDEWFEKFERSQVAFHCQRQKAGGEDCTFFKLVACD